MVIRKACLIFCNVFLKNIFKLLLFVPIFKEKILSGKKKDFFCFSLNKMFYCFPKIILTFGYTSSTWKHSRYERFKLAEIHKVDL